MNPPFWINQPHTEVTCYFCMSSYRSETIKEFCYGDGLAICPECGVDSVVFGATPIELLALNEWGFGKHVTSVRERAAARGIKLERVPGSQALIDIMTGKRVDVDYGEDDE